MPDATLQPGTRSTSRHQVTEAAIQAFADLSTDHNPVHLDPAHAATTRLGGTVAHGMLSLALVSGAITRLAPPGTTPIYLGQQARFRRPVRPGDTVVVDLEVTAWDPERHQATVATTVSLEDGTVVVTGEAVILLDPWPFQA